jgi:hypothetical protein
VPGKQPAFLFFTGDWMKDPNLSKCSAATRGIWMDLLCAMHENGRTGIITGTIKELAQMCRCSEQEMRYTIVTLQSNEVAEIRKRNAPSHKVTVVNRRMNREHKVREATKLRAQKHRAKSHRNAGGNADVTSSSSCSEELVLVSREISSSSSVSSSPSTDKLFSEEFLNQIQADPVSAGLDVRQVLKKFKGWVSEHGGDGDERHFIRWLKRERRDNGSDDRGSAEQIARVARNLSGNN